MIIYLMYAILLQRSLSVLAVRKFNKNQLYDRKVFPHWILQVLPDELKKDACS